MRGGEAMPTKWPRNGGTHSAERGYRLWHGAPPGHGAKRKPLGGHAERANLGLPVPPGFTITTEVCTYFYAHEHSYPGDLKEAVAGALAEVEHAIGAKFGDPKKPLLVSVRSGARASMPGMMDTVLN